MNLNERMNAVSGLNLPEYELIDVKELSDIETMEIAIIENLQRDFYLDIRKAAQESW